MKDLRQYSTRYQNGYLPGIPVPKEPYGIRIWNQALEQAAREAMHVAEAGEETGSEACRRVGKELEKRILSRMVEVPTAYAGLDEEFRSLKRRLERAEGALRKFLEASAKAEAIIAEE